MEIATREIEMLTTIDYNDGCTKNIKLYKVYTGNTKTPVLRYKIVEFRYPDGTIDKDRSYDCKLIIDKSDESDTKYADREMEMLKTIYYNDGCTETIKIGKVYTSNRKKPLFRFKIVKFRYPNGTIDKDRSYESTLIIDKIGESDAE